MSHRIKGFATPEGTTQYAERFAAIPARRLPRSELVATRIGFGSYRVGSPDEQAAAPQSEALRLALCSGSNLIDTSTNYTDGLSETLIGRTLSELITSNDVKRDEVILVTKVGYIQGQNLEHARAREERGIGYREVTKYSEDCWHCIHPDFIRDQVMSSLKRLGVECIDYVLLHNPEYFLKIDADQNEYYRRIRIAFECLESLADQGLIQYYGISSNTFVDDKSSHEFTSLEATIELANEINSQNRFAMVQMPFNLLEQGAVFGDANSGSSALSFAKKHSLATLINRPLNAFHDGRMLRLADFNDHVGSNPSDELSLAMALATELESRLPKDIREIVPAKSIAWAHIIKSNFGRISTPDVWSNIFNYQISPTLEDAYALLEDQISKISKESCRWLEDHQATLEKVFTALPKYLEAQAAIESKAICAQLDEVEPALAPNNTLSQKVLGLYLSLEDLDVALVGMRKTTYVKDLLRPLATTSDQRAKAVLERFLQR